MLPTCRCIPSSRANFFNLFFFSLFTQTHSYLSTSTRRSDHSRRSSNMSSPIRSSSHGCRSPDPESAANETSTTSISSIYGKNSGVEIKTCASLQEMSSVRIPAHGDRWWCILVSCVFLVTHAFIFITCIGFFFAGILLPGGARELGRYGRLFRHQLRYASIFDDARDAVAVEE